MEAAIPLKQEANVLKLDKIVVHSSKNCKSSNRFWDVHSFPLLRHAVKSRPWSTRDTLIQIEQIRRISISRSKRKTRTWYRGLLCKHRAVTTHNRRSGKTKIRKPYEQELNIANSSDLLYKQTYINMHDHQAIISVPMES